MTFCPFAKPVLTAAGKEAFWQEDAWISESASYKVFWHQVGISSDVKPFAFLLFEQMYFFITVPPLMLIYGQKSFSYIQISNIRYVHGLVKVQATLNCFGIKWEQAQVSNRKCIFQKCIFQKCILRKSHAWIIESASYQVFWHQVGTSSDVKSLCIFAFEQMLPIAVHPLMLIFRQRPFSYVYFLK